jgi:hypothetical protein
VRSSTTQPPPPPGDGLKALLDIDDEAAGDGRRINPFAGFVQDLQAADGVLREEGELWGPTPNEEGAAVVAVVDVVVVAGLIAGYLTSLKRSIPPRMRLNVVGGRERHSPMRERKV